MSIDLHNSAIPKRFFSSTVENNPYIHNATLLEVAAVEAEAVYQDFDDPSQNAPIQFPGGANVLPQGWHMATTTDSRVQIINGVAHNVTLPSNHLIGENGFGASTDFNFEVPVPNGFRIINITDDSDNGKGSGYDAYALYNNATKQLLIVNKGADSVDPSQANSPDIVAALQDGGAQLKDANAFLENTLQKLGSSAAVSQVTLIGHSLGGPLAMEQAVDMVKYHPGTAFDVITFDSIGDAPMLKAQNIKGKTLAKIEAQHLSFQGNGEIIEEGVDSGINAHLFKEDRAAATIKFPNISHDMTNFTPVIFAEAYKYEARHGTLESWQQAATAGGSTVHTQLTQLVQAMASPLPSADSLHVASVNQTAGDLLQQALNLTGHH